MSGWQADIKVQLVCEHSLQIKLIIKDTMAAFNIMDSEYKPYGMTPNRNGICLS